MILNKTASSTCSPITKSPLTGHRNYMGIFWLWFPGRQPPFQKTDFDQARERKTEDGEKSKKKKERACPPTWPRTDLVSYSQTVWTVVSLERIRLRLLAEVKRRVKWGKAATILFCFSFAGSTLLLFSRPSTWKSSWELGLWTEPQAEFCRLQGRRQPGCPSLLSVILAHFRRTLNYTYLHCNTADRKALAGTGVASWDMWTEGLS